MASHVVESPRHRHWTSWIDVVGSLKGTEILLHSFPIRYANYFQSRSLMLSPVLPCTTPWAASTDLSWGGFPKTSEPERTLPSTSCD